MPLKFLGPADDFAGVYATPVIAAAPRLNTGQPSGPALIAIGSITATPGILFADGTLLTTANTLLFSNLNQSIQGLYTFTTPVYGVQANLSGGPYASIRALGNIHATPALTVGSDTPPTYTLDIYGQSRIRSTSAWPTQVAATPIFTEAWNTPTGVKQPDFVPFTATPQYYKDDIGIVRYQGQTKTFSTSVPTAKTILSGIPQGYLPSYAITQAVIGTNGQGYSVLISNVTGAMTTATPIPNGVAIDLSDIQYRAGN